MSAAELTEAAAQMREQHGPDHERHAMWSAMADWLESVQRRRTNAYYPSAGAKDADWEHALKVARAYLGRTT